MSRDRMSRDRMVAAIAICKNFSNMQKWFETFIFLTNHVYYHQWITKFAFLSLVIRGVVNRYYTQQLKISSKDNVELSVKYDYLKPVCQSNCQTAIPTYKLSFLWMPSSQNCTCPRLKIGSEILVMGFRFGTKFAIDTRSKSLNWDSKIAKNLLAYQRKVNRDPPCS